MLEKIVAAIDGDPVRSSAVVHAVAELAERRQASVLVAHVQEVERPATLAGTPRPGALPPLLHLEGDDATAVVDSAVSELRARGISAEAQVHAGAGSTARELMDIADDCGATLIVVGDRGSRVTDLLLGSVANKIVHSASCSVLLVR